MRGRRFVVGGLRFQMSYASWLAYCNAWAAVNVEPRQMTMAHYEHAVEAGIIFC